MWRRLLLYVAPGDHLSTTQYDPRTVQIANGRGRRDEFTLDRTGFALVDHRSAVTDFSDASRLDGEYTTETTSLVRQLTGADQVVSLGWVLRRSATERRGALPPAPDVHVDLRTARIAWRYAQVHAKSALPGLPERTYRGSLHELVAHVQPTAAGVAAGAARLPEHRRRGGLAEPAVPRRLATRTGGGARRGRRGGRRVGGHRLRIQPFRGFAPG
jgi:hypothetical protein